MVDLVRLNQPGGANLRARADVGGAANAATRAGATVAGALDSIGQAVEQQGQDFMANARLAIVNAEYGEAINLAQQSAITQITERSQQTVGEDGKPNFDTMITDIQNIGAEVQNEAVKNIIDPVARQQFNTNFGKWMGTQLVSAGKKQRQQVTDYTKATLHNSLSGIASRAQADIPENIGIYEAEIFEQLSAARESGALTQEDFVKELQNATQDIRKSQYRNLMDGNPESALRQITDSSAEDLGLTPANRLQLKKEATAAFNQAQKVARGQIKQQNQEAKDLAISQWVTTGGSGVPPTGVTTADIDKHFATSIARIQEQSGSRVTFSQKVQFASNYGVPLKTLQNEAKHLIGRGDAREAAEAIIAINALKKTNRAPIEGLDDDTSAVVSLATSIYQNTGISPEAAIVEAREQVFNVDDAVRAERSGNYSKVANFQPDNIRATLIEDFEIDDTSGSFLGFEYNSSTPISGGVLHRAATIYRQGFLKTGTEEGAREYVKNKLGNTLGVSELGGNEFMFLPPEKVFSEFSSDELRADLYGDVLPFLPQDVEPSDIQIRANELSIVNPNRVSYEVFYVGPDGEEVPFQIPSEDGSTQPFYWTPDVVSLTQSKRALQKQSQEELVAAGRAERESALEFQRENPATALIAGSLSGPGLLTKDRLADFRKVKEAESNVKIQDQVDAGVRPGLGDITVQSESGGNPAAIEVKADGTAGGYGKYQLTGRTLGKFLETSPFKDEFEGLEPGTKEFNAAWVTLANDVEFQQDQQFFMLDGTYVPAVNWIKKNVNGLPISQGVDEAIFSLATQHATKSWRSIVKKAAATNPQTDAEWVKALYKERSTQFPDFVSRYRREERQILQGL